MLTIAKTTKNGDAKFWALSLSRELDESHVEH
jgi:hypothetical protein